MAINKPVTKMNDRKFPDESVRRPGQDPMKGSDPRRKDQSNIGVGPLTSKRGGTWWHDELRPGSEASASGQIVHAGYDSHNSSVNARNDHEWEPVSLGERAPVDTVSDGSKGDTLASPDAARSGRRQARSTGTAPETV